MRQWRESKSGDFPRKLAGLIKEIEAEAANIIKRFEEGELRPRSSGSDGKKRGADRLGITLSASKSA
ncbi:MAG: hypothetical protein EHM79_10080 [Geobacter sp.]|nr:MAG: hypothetical protein EHM79_10080 [Geobacter sp.]